jgi:hypothetical protein
MAGNRAAFRFREFDVAGGEASGPGPPGDGRLIVHPYGKASARLIHYPGARGGNDA